MVSRISSKTTSHEYNATISDYWELARMNKFPLGSILVFWPPGGYSSLVHALRELNATVATGLLMAAHTQATPISASDLCGTLSIFAVASTVVHCAICVLNDICDKDLDRLVGMYIITYIYP